MKPRIYLETSVISYLTAQPSRDILVAAHQSITHDLWQQRQEYEFYVSQLVHEEAARGDTTAAKARLDAIADLPALTLGSDTKELGDLLVAQLAIPVRAIEDAYHIATAAVHGMDFLLTWNCRHIANLQMRRKIERVCRSAGYEPALIGTPEELLNSGE